MLHVFKVESVFLYEGQDAIGSAHDDARLLLEQRFPVVENRHSANARRHPDVWEVPPQSFKSVGKWLLLYYF